MLSSAALHNRRRPSFCTFSLLIAPKKGRRKRFCSMLLLRKEGEEEIDTIRRENLAAHRLLLL